MSKVASVPLERLFKLEYGGFLVGFFCWVCRGFGVLLTS